MFEAQIPSQYPILLRPSALDAQARPLSVPRLLILYLFNLAEAHAVLPHSQTGQMVDLALPHRPPLLGFHRYPLLVTRHYPHPVFHTLHRSHRTQLTPPPPLLGLATHIALPHPAGRFRWGPI